MSRDVLDKWCERGILGLVLTILVFGPLAMGAVETPYFLVVQALTLSVMLLWAARLWLNPRPRFLWPPVCWAVLAFTAYAIARYFTADLEYVARQEMIRVLVYAFLFLAIINNLHRQEHAQWITLTLVFLAMTISFYALFQFITGSDKVWTLIKPYAHRGTGTYINPNHLAGFLEMILPLALAWMLVSRGKTVTKVFVGYAALVMLAGIGVTVSRGSWVSVGLMLLVFFSVLIQHRTYRLPAMVLLVTIAAAGIYFLPRTHFLKTRLEEITKNQTFNDSARFELWAPALRLWRENIWWGIGPDHFNYRFRVYRPESEQLQPDRVHNDYLNTLTDWGVAGATLVSAAWALVGIGALRTWRVVEGSSRGLSGKQSNKFALVLGASMGLLAILFHSAVDFNMHIPANAILAVTLMALLSSALRFTTDRYWFTAGIATKTAATLLLLAGLSYLSWQGARRAAEHVWLKRAVHASDQVSARLALEKAFAIEPTNFETAYACGEGLRTESWEGNSNYAQLASAAMEWFDRSMKLNRYDGYTYLRYGMCLDWLGQTDKARPYFDRAVELDPNGYFTVGYMGWHYFQTGDYAAARSWFERSYRLHAEENLIANSYLQIVTDRMLKRAAEPGASDPLRR
jgi:O-antigen ligase